MDPALYADGVSWDGKAAVHCLKALAQPITNRIAQLGSPHYVDFVDKTLAAAPASATQVFCKLSDAATLPCLEDAAVTRAIQSPRCYMSVLHIELRSSLCQLKIELRFPKCSSHPS